MCHPRYTPVAPVNAQGEYNIPLEDNENGDDRGAPFGPAPPGRHVPYQAPPPQPLPKTQGKGQNPNPPVLLEPTPPGSTPSESSSDKIYVPKTPSWMILTPRMDSLILTLVLALISTIRSKYFMRTRLIHLLHHGLGMII